MNKLLKQIPVAILIASRPEAGVFNLHGKDADRYIIQPANLSYFMEELATVKKFWISMAPPSLKKELNVI